MATYRFPEGETNIIAPALSELANRLLTQRGLTAEEVPSFLSPNYEAELHDPFLLHDMEKAVARILEAIEKEETIAIFSDYDCDGIPGAVVLHDLFKALEYPHFKNYIPHRHYEGFGLNAGAIDTLASEGVKLIITIDCGTSDVEAVAYAKSKGVDVIVTDHHEPHEVLPEAVAIINPKLGNYPFTELCGAAVDLQHYHLAIAVPGLVQQNRLVSCKSLPGLNGLSFDTLKTQGQLKFICNDIDAGMQATCDEKYACELLVMCGTGIGMSIAFNGKAFTGATGVPSQPSAGRSPR